MNNHGFISKCIWLAAVPLVLAGCAKETAPSTTTNSLGTPKSTTEWLVFMPNQSHVVMFETVPNSDVAYRVVVADLGEATLPSGLNAPSKFSSVVVNSSGNQALCTESSSVQWLFKIDGTTTTSPIVIGIKGLSDMADEYGWDLEVVANSTEDDAWGLICNTRLRDPGPCPDPEELCGSGGPGATDCSSSGGGTSCSVSCGSTYYACCNSGTNWSACQCVKS